MKWPKTILPKEKILPLADILNLNKKTQILELEKWMLTVHKGKKSTFLELWQETERQEIKMNEICWNWLDTDKTFTFYYQRFI